MSDSREELERSIRCEAQLRAQIFELRDQNQKLQAGAKRKGKGTADVGEGGWNVG